MKEKEKYYDSKDNEIGKYCLLRLNRIDLAKMKFARHVKAPVYVYINVHPQKNKLVGFHLNEEKEFTCLDQIAKGTKIPYSELIQDGRIPAPEPEVIIDGNKVDMAEFMKGLRESLKKELLEEMRQKPSPNAADTGGYKYGNYIFSTSPRGDVTRTEAQELVNYSKDIFQKFIQAGIFRPTHTEGRRKNGAGRQATFFNVDDLQRVVDLGLSGPLQDKDIPRIVKKVWGDDNYYIKKK